MAFGNVKGLTVEIGADASSLEAEIRKIKSQFSGLDKTASALKKSMTFDDGTLVGFESFGTYQDLIKRKIAQTQSELDKYKSTLESLPDQVKQWESQLDDAKLGMEQFAQAASVSASNIQTFKNAQDSLQNELNEVETAYNKQMEVIKQHSNEVEIASNNISKHQRKIEEVTGRYESWNAKLEENKNIVKLNSEALLMEEATMDSIRNEIEKQKNIISGAKDEQSKLNEQIDRYSILVEKGGSSCERYKSVLEMLKKSYERQSNVINEANAEIERLNVEYDKSKNKSREYSEEINKASKKIESAKKNISSYEKELQELRKEEEQLKVALEEARSGFDGQNDEVKLLEELMAELRKEINHVNSMLSQEKAKLKESQDAYRGNANASKKLEEAIKNQGESYSFLKAKVETLKNNLEKLKIELLENSQAFHQFKVRMEGIGTKLQDVGRNISNVGTALTILSAGVLRAFKYGVDQVVSFDDAWASVTKTVSGTEAQMESVKQGLKELATTTASSYEAITQNAEIAGQMGVATDSIVTFTKVITQLGDTTNLEATEAGKAIAQMANIMVSEAERTNDYYERVGATIVDLGNNFATTETDIVNMSQRMAVGGKQAGFNTQQILALSTALSSLGLRAQEGGSTMSKMLQNMQLAVKTGTDNMENSLEDYAKVVGMTADEFKKSWEDDAASAFLYFVSKIGSGTKSSLEILDKLGITSEIKLTRVMSSLSESSDVLNSALDRANRAWDENTALTIEAEKRYGTLKSQFSQTKENLKQLAESMLSSATPTIENFLEHINSMIDYLDSLDDSTKQTIIVTGGLVAGLGPLVKVVGLATSGFGSMLKVIGNIPFTMINASKNTVLFGKALKGAIGGKTLVASLESTIEDIEILTAETVTSESALGKMLVTAKGTSKAMGIFSSALGGVALALGLGVAEYKMFTNMHDEYNKKIEETIKEYSVESEYAMDVANSIKEINNQINAHGEKADEYINSYVDMTKEAKKYAKEIINITKQEELDESQKDILARYIQRLNELYPELGVTLDETGTKIVDNTGTIIDNKKALYELIDAQDEYIKHKAYSNAINEYKQASVEAEIQYGKQAKALKILEEQQADLIPEADKYLQRMADLNKLNKENKITQEEFNHYSALALQNYTDTKSQIDKITESKKELVQGMKDELQAMKDNTQAAYELTQQESGTNKLASSVEDSMKIAIDLAKKGGYEIPNAIKEALENPQSTVKVQEGIEALASIETYQKLLDDASINGKLIPKRISEGIMLNSGDVEEATDNVNMLIDFQSAIEKSGLQGTELLKKFTEGIDSNPQSVLDAINTLNSYVTFNEAVSKAGRSGEDIVKEYSQKILDGTVTAENAAKELGIALDISDEASQGAKNSMDQYNTEISQGIDKAIDESEDKAKQIPEKLDVSNEANASGNNIGQKFYDGLAPWLQSVVSAASDAASQIISSFDSASSSVSQTKASIGKGGTPSGILSFAESPFSSFNGGLDARAFGNYSTPTVGSSIDVVNASRNLKSVKDNRNGTQQGINEVLNKLDSFIEAFGNVQLNTRTQLVTPNGEALTDMVQDTMTIRDMLSDIGRGKG